MKAAASVIGWVAIGLVGGWLAWWAATLSDATPHASSTVALGSVLLLTWLVSTILVWQHTWLAILGFATAAVLPLTPEQALPAPTLLVAVSAALAVWAGLAGVVSRITERTWPPADPDDRAALASDQPVPPHPCLICQRPAETTMCAACAAALGPQASAWM